MVVVVMVVTVLLVVLVMMVVRVVRMVVMVVVMVTVVVVVVRVMVVVVVVVILTWLYKFFRALLEFWRLQDPVQAQGRTVPGLAPYSDPLLVFPICTGLPVPCAFTTSSLWECPPLCLMLLHV